MNTTLSVRLVLLANLGQPDVETQMVTLDSSGLKVATSMPEVVIIQTGLHDAHHYRVVKMLLKTETTWDVDLPKHETTMTRYST